MIGRLIRYTAFVGWGIVAVEMGFSGDAFLTGFLALAAMDFSRIFDKNKSGI